MLYHAIYDRQRAWMKDCSRLRLPATDLISLRVPSVPSMSRPGDWTQPVSPEIWSVDDSRTLPDTQTSKPDSTQSTEDGSRFRHIHAFIGRADVAANSLHSGNLGPAQAGSSGNIQRHYSLASSASGSLPCAPLRQRPRDLGPHTYHANSSEFSSGYPYTPESIRQTAEAVEGNTLPASLAPCDLQREMAEMEALKERVQRLEEQMKDQALKGREKVRGGNRVTRGKRK